MSEKPTFKSTIVKLDAVVGMMSLIGTGPHRPCSWGNYFWLHGAPAPRIANMWAENLQELVRNGTLSDGRVKVKLYEDLSKTPDSYDGPYYAIVVDDRIPSEDWLYNKLCFTGGYRPHIDIIRDMFSVLGDPTNAIEEYEDPKSYYEKQGGTYDEKTGCISFTLKSESHPLKEGWTIETVTEASLEPFPMKRPTKEDAGFFYCPYIPKDIA